MDGIERLDICEEYAYSGLVRAGDFCFVNFCVGNVGQSVERQVAGAVDDLERRLRLIGLGLDSVVQIDCLFRDAWDIPAMERVLKERFHGCYPARKSIQTNFAHKGGEDGLLFQMDAVAYAPRG